MKLGVLAILLILVLSLAGVLNLSAVKGGQQGTTQTTTSALAQNNGQAQCATTTAQGVVVLGTHYAGDSSISNMQWNRFYASTGSVNGQSNQPILVQTPDNPGTITDGTASTATTNNYAVGTSASGVGTQGPIYDQLTQSSGQNAYPFWVLENPSIINTPLQLPGGSVQFTIACQGSSSNSAVSNWKLTGVLPEAPASCTSATTNCKATITYPGGAAAPTAWPTSATTWNLNLLIFSNYKAAGLPYAECGTVSNPVTNYAQTGSGAGTVFSGCPNGPGQGGLPTVTGVWIAYTNVSAVSFASPGAIAASTGQNGMRAWVIPVTGGCQPAPGSGVSSTSPYTCISTPVTLYETQSQGSSKGNIVFTFVDFQQSYYVSQYLSLPAQKTGTGMWVQASGSVAGINASVTGLTPTSGQNAGNPAPLAEQSVSPGPLTY